MTSVKKILFTLLIYSIIYRPAQAQSIDSLGLPGDNLNLYGVLFLFKESKTVEEFETKLNSNNTKINNLDLNHDGQTDYIRVIDYGKNGLHTLVLTDPITEKETQDLATIEIEQKGNGVAHIQIVGDEDLYGKNYIIEPNDTETGSKPQSSDNQTTSTVLINVWSWPGVQYVYAPSYTYWSSPWYWGYYPVWRSPWVTISYHSYWQGTYGFRNHHQRVYRNRMMAAHNVYYSRRRESPIVHNNIHNNVYYGPRKTGGSPNPRNSKNPNRENGLRNAEEKKNNRINNERREKNPNPQPGNRRQQNVKRGEGKEENSKRGGNPNPQPNRAGQQRGQPSENRGGQPNPKPNSPRQENNIPGERRGGSPNPKPNAPKQERVKPSENRGGHPNPQPNPGGQNKAGQENRAGGRKK